VTLHLERRRSDKEMAIEASDKSARIQAAARLNPVWWIETILGIKLWQLQKLIARSVAENSRTTVRSCEGSGKSFDAACIALWFLYNYVPSTVITTAPTDRQVKEILWREISQKFYGARMELGGTLTEKKLDLSDEHFAIGFTTDEPEKFQGFHNVNILVIGDEASGITETCFNAMENPLGAGVVVRQLLIGNPTQSVGTFRDSHSDPLFKQFHISAFDTPNFTEFGITLEDIQNGAWQKKLGDKELPYPSLVPPAIVAERLEKWGLGSFLFQTKCMGNFADAGVNNLIPLHLIEDAMAREPIVDPRALIMAAVDISRYGDDETVFGWRQGDKIFPFETWHHQDTMYTAGRTSRYIAEHKPIQTRVDVIGVGAGVVDRLQEKSVPGVEAFNVSEAAVDKELFASRRAELYFQLLTLLREGTLSLPNDPVLKSQLADLRYKYKSNGQLRMETKEEARNRGSHSPDRADVVMMLAAPMSVKKADRPRSKCYL